jgi:sugar phosphate isomerase/epimerase
MNSDRREFLLRAAALGAGALAMQGIASAQEGTPKRKRPKVALQLYSVRDDCAKDFAGTVRKVAEMGYEGVEFAGTYGMSAADVRNLLDDCDLRAAGAHVGLGQLQGEELPKTIEFYATVGCRFLIVPGMGGDTKAAWEANADALTAAAEQLKPHGMWTGYHNHTGEFSPLEGSTAWDTLFTRSSKDVVMQIDSGHMVHAGVDPVAYIEKYPGRQLTVHVKEWKTDGSPVLVGQGDVKWDAFFQACETLGDTRWYTVEQEVYPVPPMEAVAKCLDQVREWGKL